MRFSKLTFLAFNLNYLLDRSYYKLSLAEVKEKIRDKTLFDFLKGKTRDDYLDLSLLDDNDKKELLEEFENLADNVDENRKMGIQNNGICLLLAYVIELIQRKGREGIMLD